MHWCHECGPEKINLAGVNDANAADINTDTELKCSGNCRNIYIPFKSVCIYNFSVSDLSLLYWDDSQISRHFSKYKYNNFFMNPYIINIRDTCSPDKTSQTKIRQSRNGEMTSFKNRIKRDVFHECEMSKVKSKGITKRIKQCSCKSIWVLH